MTKPLHLSLYRIRLPGRGSLNRWWAGDEKSHSRRPPVSLSPELVLLYGKGDFSGGVVKDLRTGWWLGLGNLSEP